MSSNKTGTQWAVSQWEGSSRSARPNAEGRTQCTLYSLTWVLCRYQFFSAHSPIGRQFLISTWQISAFWKYKQQDKIKNQYQLSFSHFHEGLPSHICRSLHHYSYLMIFQSLSYAASWPIKCHSQLPLKSRPSCLHHFLRGRICILSNVLDM